MSSKPLIILASARKESDTAKIVRRLFGCDEADVLDLLDYSVSHYRYDGTYPPADQFMVIMERLLQHEQLVFATPVYWYAMSGLLKVFFDRLTDIVTINKVYGRRMQGKRTFLIAVGADDSLPEGFEVPFKLTSDYLAMDFKGSYYCKNSEIDVKGNKASIFKQLVCATKKEV
jgi:multimeric flavodoxin WrbA